MYLGRLLSYAAIWWVKLSQTSLITRWCCNEWMYEDVSVTARKSCPYSCSSAMIRSLLLIMPLARLVWKRMVISNFDVWCSMMKNTSPCIWAKDAYCVIPLLLRIGTVQGSTDICLLLVQIQRIYIYLLLSHHHSSSCDLVLLITPLSAQTLEQRHLSTRLHSSYPAADICYEWLLAIDEQLMMANSNSCGFKDHWYLPMYLWKMAAYLVTRYDLIRKPNLVSIYPRCWVIGENVIWLRWWPFWKWRHIGRLSHFGDGNIHFSCWDRCQ